MALVASLAVAACTGDTAVDASAVTDDAGENRREPKTAAEGADIDLATVTIGVAECDKYVRAYAACLSSDRMPEQLQVALTANLRRSIPTLVRLASKPQTAQSAVDACRSAIAATQKSTAQFGCTW